MSRLCDDLMTHRLFSRAEDQPASDLERRWWTVTLPDCERFEVSPVLQMLLGGGVDQAGWDALEAEHLPSLKLPYRHVWIEGMIPASFWRSLPPQIGGTDFRRFGAVFFEIGTEPGETLQLAAHVAFETAGAPEWRHIGAFHAALYHQPAPDGVGSVIVRDWQRIMESTISSDAEACVRHFVNALLYSMSLLNCRNVESVVVEPAPKVQARRAKRGRLPLYSYRELVVRVGKALRPLASFTEGSSRDLPLHAVRGHFKHFTPERPAFGRVVGTFWCPPFLRGDKVHGVVEKEYVLEPEPVA